MYTRRIVQHCVPVLALIIPAAMALLVVKPVPLMAASTQAVQQLQVSIAASAPQAAAPFPIRVTLHLHNAGGRPFWLYMPAIDAGAMTGNQGGSTLAVHLQPKAPKKTGIEGSMPAMGTVLRVAGFPHPKLIAVQPGGSVSEDVAIYALPSKLQTSTGPEPQWGTYTMSLAYSASYPNGGEIRRNLGVDLWSGSILTNPVDISLEPPASSAAGMISGTVTNRSSLTLAGILVSLTDNQERIVTQSVTGPDGGFRFSHLPLGRYWVTVRSLGADHDTSFFEHADLGAGEPGAQMKLIMLSQEIYEARRLLHKPVLFRVEDGAGNPVSGADLKVLWSDGPVIENLKVESDQNGLAVINLIPGSNYVTVSKRHCPKVDQMAGVRPGGGIDGFRITFNCESR